MKRKAIENNREQWHKLQALPSLNAEQCRKIVSALSEDGSGGRMMQRQAERHPTTLPLLRTVQVPGKSREVTVQHFQLSELLQAKADSCRAFRAALAKVIRKSGGRLRLVYYADEATPGNVLSPLLNRKTMLSYITFLELEGLHQESRWLTLSLMRTSQIARCQGGFAGVLRSLLETVQTEAKDGFPLQLSAEEGPRLVFISRVLILGDHEQLRQCTGAKGASGKKPCLKCRNVLSLGHTDIRGHCDVQEHDTSKFLPQTQTGVLAILRHLQSLPSQSKVNEAETLLGWNLATAANSFIVSESLTNFAEVEDCYFDGMHGYFSNGVVAQELGLWYTAMLEKSEARLQHLQEYHSSWRPAREALEKLKLDSYHFTTKCWRKGADFRGDADACLCMLPICVQFGEDILRADYPDMTSSLDSLQALYKVCLCLQAAKDDQASSADSLPSLQRQHGAAFANAYALNQRPKMHFNLHLPAQIQKWGKYLDAFACERKHKAFKTVAENFSKLATFEKGVLLEMSSRELRREEIPDRMLSGKHTVSSSLARATGCKQPVPVARHLRCDGKNFSSGDCLLLSADQGAEIVCAAMLDSEPALLIEPLQLVSRSGVSSLWERTGTRALLQVENLTLGNAVSYKCELGGNRLRLLP